MNVFSFPKHATICGSHARLPEHHTLAGLAQAPGVAPTI